jgi:superoxide dismutase, Fe-Mn family
MNKRQFLKNIGLFSVASSFFSFSNTDAEDYIPTHENTMPINGSFTLPALPYAFDALEDVIDKQTMEIHHGKHHKAYVDNLNKAITKANLDKSLEDICRSIGKKSNPLLRNNAGGHWNHSFFWETMSPQKNQQPGPKFTEAMLKNFSSFEAFKKLFSAAAQQRFGSGWAWVIKNKFGGLEILSTANQDNPLMSKKIVEKQGTPILALDVWEHAYYLKYQNKRVDYINRFFDIINWQKVEERMGV